ncbi:amine oxidase [Aspergillus pseudoustus]|uniref:Amine oxidase n=1 Tax=Aspergillus pseudoustus TaxID=1810923 RepID=A0ABR4JXT2_9EURO
MFSKKLICAVALAAQPCVATVPKPQPQDDSASCSKTTVAILGGGMAGVAAAQALSNSSIDDFIIIEYRDTLGGRVAHTNFGRDANGDPYTVELGANWVQGLGSPGGPENPIWTFAKKWGLNNTFSNYSSILTYNETGYTDYSALLDDYETLYESAEEQAGVLLKENLQDQTARTGLALAGWKPKLDEMARQAVEWWEWDWEDAFSPEESSFIFGVAGSNLTFNQFSDENNFVWDQRGYNRIIQQEALSFFDQDDPRLHLSSRITNITYAHEGVTVYKEDGSCVEAAYAVCTFSLGVLQNDDAVSFSPTLPYWKRTAIAKFSMGTYTKIFLQFNETFWPRDTQYFLYASPTTRGYYPVWQSLAAPGFIPESNIIFVTVVSDEAHRIERQSDEQTKAEVMAVLCQMFPDITVPEPTAIMYPRWSTAPWAYGSYSNWPASTTLEMHENLRANVGRLWFAGEATSAQYFGFLHGAWFEGRGAGEQIAALLRGECGSDTEARDCGNRRHYERLHGSSPLADYSVFNGWPVSSFYSSA